MKGKLLRFRYTAEFRLDRAGPRWTESVLEGIRLPRWTYSGKDKGAFHFVRALQRLDGKPVDVTLLIEPQPMTTMPNVSLWVDWHGKWTDKTMHEPVPAWIADLHEEAEALLVLLGCRGPRFHYDKRELLS